MGQFFDELKRRNVFRVAVAYVVATWLILQVADVVLDGIEAPAWVMKVFMLVLGIGFPLVLAFSWAYELTPEGLKKETDVDRSSSITPETGRKLDIVTIGMLVTVIGFLVVDRFVLEEPSAREDAPANIVAADGPPERSIAVLAFEDLSADGDQEYFADGLSEELLNVLAKVPDLQVAGRTSSFAFKGKHTDLREIGEALNVAHILEGSVRKAGNRIRVTAQLIKASDGYHVYSETFDRNLDDIFAVQDEISAAISDALLAEIVGTQVARATPTDTETYDLFLMARQRTHSRDLTQLQEAEALLDRALEIDPLYAPALAQKALVLFLQSDTFGAYGDLPTAEIKPVSMRLVEQAIAIDPGLAEAYALKGLLLSRPSPTPESLPALERAREINPSLSDASNWLAGAYMRLGRSDEAIEVMESVVAQDPTYGVAVSNLVQYYARAGNTDKAIELIERVERIVGKNDFVLDSYGIVDVMDGNAVSAVRNLRAAYDMDPSSSVRKSWLSLALYGVADFDTIVDVGMPIDRMIALAALGEAESALPMLETIDLDTTFVPRAIDDIALYFCLAGQCDAIVDYVTSQFGSVENLLEDYPASLTWGSAYLGRLAYALRLRGDDAAAEALLPLMRSALDENVEQGTVNLVTLFCEAQLAALQGDAGKTAEYLEMAVDAGLRGALLTRDGVFPAVMDDESMTAVARRIDETLAADRKALGLPPYRPPMREPSRPAFVN